jgi:hypothetical protein
MGFSFGAALIRVAVVETAALIVSVIRWDEKAFTLIESWPRAESMSDVGICRQFLEPAKPDAVSKKVSG